jgi:hypothetical protein
MENIHNLKNAQLKAEHPDIYAKLESGKCVVLGVGFQTRTPGTEQICVGQMRSDCTSTPLSEVDTVFMGTPANTPQILRCFQRHRPAFKSFQVGEILPEVFNIEVKDTDEGPQFLRRDGSPQDCRRRPDGSPITREGAPVYRVCKLIMGRPTLRGSAQVGVITDIDRTPAVVPIAPAKPGVPAQFADTGFGV